MRPRMIVDGMVLLSPALLIGLGWLVNDYSIAGVGATAIGAIVDPLVGIIAFGVAYSFRRSGLVLLWAVPIGLVVTLGLQVLLAGLDPIPSPGSFRPDAIVGRVSAFVAAVALFDLILQLRKAKASPADGQGA